MPTYTFKHVDTGDTQEVVLPMSKLQAFKEANPDLTQIITAGTPIVRNSGKLKPDNGFRDVLKSIKKANIHSNINTF